MTSQKEPLSIKTEVDYAIIRFTGYVDASTTENARGAISQKIPAACSRIIVDLSEVDFLDSHGVGLFASLLKRAHKAGGRLFFVGAHGQPVSVLKMVGFSGPLVTYCDTLQQAGAFAGGKGEA